MVNRRPSHPCRRISRSVCEVEGRLMQVQARDLTAGDVVELNDWSLHVIAVECEQAVAVMT
jgi:hypothetical protein